MFLIQKAMSLIKKARTNSSMLSVRALWFLDDSSKKPLGNIVCALIGQPTVICQVFVVLITWPAQTASPPEPPPQPVF
jgi:hypothetical protein